MTNNDLISRSALITAINTNSPTFYDGQDIANWQAKCINEAPAVDAEPVQHGKWQFNPNGIYNDNTWVCSVCGEPWTLIDGNTEENFMYYCPHCGAKMDGGTKTDVRND